MMTRDQLLFQCLSEECSEVAVRCSKANRFTPEEIQPNQKEMLTNAERVVEELVDLLTVMELMVEEGHIRMPSPSKLEEMKKAKRKKIEEYYDYSVIRRTVEPRQQG
jgi:hypothetical protein